MKRASVSIVIAAALVLAAGCSKPPETEIQASRDALSAAREAQAAEYAPESLQSAEDALERLEAELKVQEERFALMRSYDTATSLANEAKTSAERAASDAASGKERMRVEVEQSLASARTTLDEVRALVANAPVGKGSTADIAALQSDLTGIEQQLTTAQSTFDSGNYIEARAQVQAAMQDVERVRSDVQAAMDASGQARRVS
jgi:hypothetical protein